MFLQDWTPGGDGAKQTDEDIAKGRRDTWLILIVAACFSIGALIFFYLYDRREYIGHRVNEYIIHYRHDNLLDPFRERMRRRGA